MSDVTHPRQNDSRNPEDAATTRVGPPPAPGARPLIGTLTDAVLLALVAIALVLPGMATLPPSHPAEVVALARTAALLQASGWADVLSPGAPEAPVPPLVPWLQALASTVWSGDAAAPAWVARLPSAAAVVIAVLATYSAGLAAGGRRAGLLAGLLFPAALLAGLAARMASADAVVLAAVTIVGAALVHLAAEADPRPRALRTLAFWGGLAGAILAGGWLAVAVVVPMILALPLVDRSFERLRALDPARGSILLVVLLAPTALAMLVRGFEAGWPGTVGLAGWFAAPDPGRFAPPGTHLVLALATAWPLSAFVPLLLAAPRDRQPDVRRRRVRIVLAAWVLPAWLLIEVLPDKRPLDVLPLLPPLAVLVGLVLAAAPLPSGRLSARVGYALLAAGAVLLCFVLNAGFVLAAGHASAVGLAGAAVAIVAAFAAVWLLLRGRLMAALPLVLVAAGVVAWLAFDSLDAATLSAWTIWFS